MTAKHRSRLTDFLLTLGLLLAAFNLYYIVGLWGLLDYLRDGALKTYLSGPGVHLEVLISAIGFSATIVLTDIWSDSTSMRRRPVGQIILLKTVIFLSCLVVVAVITNVLLLLFIVSIEEWKRILGAMTGKLAFSLAGLFIVSVLSVNFIREVRRKVGPGNLAPLLTGRYHTPRSENRLFLFIDLQSSTAIAEQLGHEHYSQLLRECFHDLTGVVLESGASVYQYVGDEVVLTWKARNGNSALHCLEAFFGFERQLAMKREFYLERFGVVPEFHAGAEVGKVTATEVGDIKRDIAYHGDPLNTAARLLELCKSDRRQMLISDQIERAVRDAPRFATDWLGEFQLRGKAEKTGVYEVAITE